MSTQIQSPIIFNRATTGFYLLKSSLLRVLLFPQYVAQEKQDHRINDFLFKDRKFTVELYIYWIKYVFMSQYQFLFLLLELF